MTPHDPKNTGGENQSGREDSEASAWVVEIDDDGTDFTVQSGRGQASWTAGISPGDVFGDHEMVRLIGRSKTDEIWQARDPILKSHHAVRVLHPQLAANTAALEQFFNLGRAQAILHHPAIVQVFRVGKQGALPFFIMEWVEGELLAERLKREGKLTPQAACNILLQAISALSYAKEEGLSHGNLSPFTILLANPDQSSKDRRSRVKIKDFGQTPILPTAPDQTRIMSPVAAQYMSPEDVTGIPADHRSDIYCLGILFYHMLIGETPFHGADRGDILFRQVHDAFPEPPELRQMLGDAGITVLRRMSEKRQAARYQTYGDLQKALQGLAIAADRRAVQPTYMAQSDQRSSMAQTPGPDTPPPAAPIVEQPGAAAARKKILMAVAAIAAIAVGAVLIIPRLKDKEPPREVTAVAAPASTPGGGTATPTSAPTVAPTPVATPFQQPVVSPAPALTTTPYPAKTATPVAASPVETAPPIVSPPTEQVGLVVDNATPGSVILKPDPGAWKLVGLPGSYQNTSLLATADGSPKSATFVSDVPADGVYEVMLWWLPDERLRSPQVVCTVNTATGPFKGMINQVGSGGKGRFTSIGKYPLKAGEKQAVVSISTEGIPKSLTTLVSVDALQLVPTTDAAAPGQTPVILAQAPAAAVKTAVAQADAEPQPSIAPGSTYPPGDEDIVIEAAPGGKNRDLYREIAGNWIESKTPPHTAKSKAEGCTTQALCGSKKVVFCALGTDVPARHPAIARFNPSFTNPGHYNVYVTWPHGANVNPVNYVVHHADGITTRTLIQDGFGPEPGEPNNSNVWIRLGDYNFKPGDDSYLELVMLPGARATHSSANGQVYADAVRFSPRRLPEAQEDDTTTTKHILMKKGEWKKPASPAGSESAQATPP